MKPVLAFMMHGRWQPVLFMAAATLVPLLAWLGGAVLALVTLRRGAAEGGLVMVGAALTMGVAFAAMGVNPVVSVAGLLEYWLPVFVLAAVLRATVSLPLTVLVSAGLGSLALVAWYALVQDPAAFWTRSLGGMFEGEEGADLMRSLSPVMSGFWILGLWSLSVGSLLLARWWQAVLYNPGGFREEFHGLRLDWRFAAGTLVVMLLATFSGPGLVYDLSLLVSGVFAVQALAVAHCVAHARGWHWILLVPVYGLMPFLFKLYALLGIVDTWFDLRQRLISDNGG